MTRKNEKSQKLLYSKNPSIHLLFGPINDDTILSVCEWILQSNFSENPPEALTLFINSEGGDLHSAFACIEMMKGSRIPIHTIGVGQICSAGLILFLAGEVGHRVLTSTCSIMSHDYRTEVSGPHHELVAVQKELNFTHDRIVEHYKTRTGLSEKLIRKHLISSGDNWLSPAEAVKLGIADKIAGI